MTDLENNFRTNTISEVLHSIVKRKGWDNQYYQAQITNNWEKIVGTKIFEETLIHSLKNGILTIRTNSSTWRTELSLRSEQLITKINEELQSDVVEKIVIR